MAVDDCFLSSNRGVAVIVSGLPLEGKPAVCLGNMAPCDRQRRGEGPVSTPHVMSRQQPDSG